MTEEEAKTTRCCGPEGCGIKKEPFNDRYCIGSACMAWRWDDRIAVDRHSSWVVRDRYGEPEPAKPTGYCGLAGRP
jgi:hypothetical protein